VLRRSRRLVWRSPLLFGVLPIKGITNETLAEMLTWKKFPADINAALRTRRFDLRQELYRLVPELKGQGDRLPGDEYQGEKVIALDASLVASDVHEFTLLLASNCVTASRLWAPVRAGSVASGGTRQLISPATPSTSRLVARIRSRGHRVNNA
jgi:hypothetical protein